MFTGIISGVGRIVETEPLGDDASFGKRVIVETPPGYLDDVQLGDSIAIAGACMTATTIDAAANCFSFDVSGESLDKTAGLERPGAVNLEKALRAHDRLGGHLVTGHVDGLGSVVRFVRIGESWELRIEAPKALARFLAYKGSVTVNGVSLTVNNVADTELGVQFSINLIPHTLEHTTLGELSAGTHVNLEIDLIARYVERMLEARRPEPCPYALAREGGAYNSAMAISPIPELVAELAAGRMVILVDEEDRENEGDIILAAEHVTPEAINFMAKHARGLICLTLTREHCERLQLAAMTARNGTKHGTAFTVSIEAAEGISTGISAADRARTVQAAVARNAKPSDLVHPGHIFPLQAQDGGVLMRAGHTEAGCDLAGMAGLAPASVICEVMKDDGTMARLPDLEDFAQQHGLKIGTIAALIEHRSRNETLVERAGSRTLTTAQGPFDCVAFRDRTGALHLALRHGQWQEADEILVRVHEPLSILDLLDAGRCAHSWPLPRALAAIQQAGRGVAVLLNCGEDTEALARNLQPEPSAEWQQRSRMDLRKYGVGAQILRELGVSKMKLLGNPRRMPSMAGYGLEVTSFLADDQADHNYR